MKQLRIVKCCLLCFLLLCLTPAAGFAEDNYELPSGYITVLDEHRNILLQTGILIQPGDQFIDPENRLYEISTIEGFSANARFMGTEAISDLYAPAAPVQAGAANSQATPPPPASASPSALIAIYHTHTDESYTPTDGAPTQPGKGGILRVGDAFAQRLTENGLQVAHDKTLHEPHDANAYQRSRRTAVNLLTQQPSAIFDIHRDSAPANMYNIDIGGKPATKILLVVGKQNQNRLSSLEYAKTIKGSADSKYPGLIRGIFIAHGNYNQDLNPHAMLIEIGTQFNTREAAERSAALFADVVPSLVSAITGAGSTAPPPAAPSETPAAPPTSAAQAPETATPINQAYAKDAAWILGITVAGIVLYLFLSTGSWREAKAKLRKFAKTEFVNFFGPRRKK